MPRREPRFRIARELIPLEGGRKWVRFGGFGNSSGKQGERDPGFKIWNDQFHGLGDLWVLDLANGKWECIVPAPGLELPNSHACADVAEHNALLMVPAHDNATPEGTPPEIHVLRLEKGANFQKVGSRGEVPNVRGQQFPTALPGGRTHAAFVIAGSFELTLACIFHKPLAERWSVTGFTACLRSKPVTDRRSTRSAICAVCEICGLEV